MIGLFAGNAVTVLYMGQQQARVGASTPAPQRSAPRAAVPEALRRLEAAAASAPTNADGWVKLGNYCFDNDMPAKAVDAYEHAVELAPMRVNVWSDLGVMYRRIGQFEKAVDAFGHAASLDPSHVVSRFNQGIVYLHDLNNPVEARKAWESVLAIDPNAKSPGGESVADLLNGLRK